MNEDVFLTIDEGIQTELNIKQSKFIGYAYHIQDEEQAKAILQIIQKEHPKAVHCCYAFDVGLEQNLQRYSDDGEPSGTAGRPIAGQIKSFGLKNTLLLVIRYYGGIKLGTSGLIKAYKNTAKACLENSKFKEAIIYKEKKINVDLSSYNEFKSKAQQEGFIVKDENFGFKKVELSIQYKKSQLNALEIFISHFS